MYLHFVGLALKELIMSPLEIAKELPHYAEGEFHWNWSLVNVNEAAIVKAANGENHVGDG